MAKSKAAERTAAGIVGITEDEVARELEKAGIVKGATAKAASAKPSGSPSRGSGGSKNKKTTAKQRRRR